MPARGHGVQFTLTGVRPVYKAERFLVLAAVAATVAGCGGGGGGGTTGLQVPEGATSPEQAVEGFLRSAQDAMLHKRAGAFTEADRDYERMAAVFGTERGSVHRSMSAEEVRDRMIVLSACLRPAQFRIIAQSDALARQTGKAAVSVDLKRTDDELMLPFSVVLGRDNRWFIDKIDLNNVSC